MSFSVIKSARLISIITLASRILGLLRDMAVTHAFGVGSVASAFWTAFQVPNLFRRLFGEGAISAASIPVLTETLTRQGKESADALAGRIIGLLLVILAIVCVLGEVVIAVLYWRYQDRTDSALLLALSAVMFPYLIFICTAALLGGVQNVFGKFASAAAAPLILNLFMIVAATGGQWLNLEMRTAIFILSVAVVISGIFQLAWQWLATRRCDLRLPLRIDAHDPSIRRIALTMLPMIGGLATVQFNTLADALIAWWFVPEVIVNGQDAERVGPAVLSLAQRLYQFPLGVFAIALATAIFPALSRHAAEHDDAGLARTLSRGLRITAFEGLPCLLGLILIREPLIRVLFGRGEFLNTPGAVDRVGLALFMYALGIWAFGVNQLMVRAFYALGDAKTPLRISVINVAINLALNLLLVHTRLRESGLALATTICATLQVVALLIHFQRRNHHLAWAEIGRSLLRAILATTIMGVAVWLVDGYYPDQYGMALRLLVMVATGAVSFSAAAVIFRCPEMREILRR